MKTMQNSWRERSSIVSEKNSLVCLAIHSNVKQNPGMPKWSHSLAFAFLRAYFTTSPCYDQFSWQDLNHYENDDIQEMIREVLALRARILAISCYVWNMEAVREILLGLRYTKERMTIILGGPEMNENSDHWLDDAYGVDHIVFGEGEITFRALLEHLCGAPDAPLEAINGLLYRDLSGVIRKNPARKMITDLDSIPSPYLLGFIPPATIHHGLVGLETQRGCVLDCAFCNYQKGFRNVRFFALDRVMQEIELIVSHRPRQLNLMDPTFNSNRKRAKAILKKIIASKSTGHEMFINAEMVPDMLDDEMIRLAKEAGFNYFELGVQSLNQDAIASMGRYRNETKLFDNIQKALEHGLRVVPHLIFGLPGDSLHCFLDSFDRIYRIPTEDLTLMQLLLLPGTRFHDQAQALGIEYNPQAPYQIRQSQDFSREDIELLEKMNRLVLITQPMKRDLVSLMAIADVRPSELFLNFVRENTKNLLIFDWPLKKKDDKILAMQAIEAFYEFVLACFPVDAGQHGQEAFLQQLAVAKRSSQIVLV